MSKGDQAVNLDYFKLNLVKKQGQFDKKLAFSHGFTDSRPV